MCCGNLILFNDILHLFFTATLENTLGLTKEERVKATRDISISRLVHLELVHSFEETPSFVMEHRLFRASKNIGTDRHTFI